MIRELSQALLNFADQVSANIPGAVSSTVGERLIDTTEFAVRREFEALERRLPKGPILDYAERQLSNIPPDADEILPGQRDTIRQMMLPAIEETSGWVDNIGPLIALAFATGALQVEQSFRKMLPKSRPTSGRPGRRVRLLPGTTRRPDEVILQLGRRRMFTAAKGFNETSLRTLTQVIDKAMIEEKTRGVPVIARRIREAFPDMDTRRSRLIATTEMNFAMSRGAFDRAAKLGSKLKQWITVGDDRVDELVCLPNEANSGQGIPINSAFTSGHMTTPGHPRCRCVVAFFGATRVEIDEGLSPAGEQSWIAGINENALPHRGNEALFSERACSCQ